MTVIFRTERLVVRPWETGDLDDVFAMNRDPEVTRYLPDYMACATRDEARAWLETRIERHDPTSSLGFWATVEASSGRVIGGATLMRAQIGGANLVEIGYYFHQSVWGKGYATELAAGLLRYGFDTLDEDQIVAVIIPENAASGRVLEKAGMRHAGQSEYNGHVVELYVMERPE